MAEIEEEKQRSLEPVDPVDPKASVDVANANTNGTTSQSDEQRAAIADTDAAIKLDDKPDNITIKSSDMAKTELIANHVASSSDVDHQQASDTPAKHDVDGSPTPDSEKSTIAVFATDVVNTANTDHDHPDTDTNPDHDDMPRFDEYHMHPDDMDPAVNSLTLITNHYSVDTQADRGGLPIIISASPATEELIIPTPPESPPRSVAGDDVPSNNNPKPASAGTVPFYKLFRFADRYDFLLMLLGSIGAAVNGVTIPLISLLFGDVIDAFGKNAADKHKIMHSVSQVSLEFLYLGIVAFVVSSMQVGFWMVTGERQASRIRARYLEAILRQDVAFFDKESATGEFIGRMSGDTVIIQDAIGEKVGKVIQLVSTFLGGFGIAFYRGWQLTLMMLVTIPPLVVAGAVVTIIISKATSQGQEAYAKAGGVVEQAVGAIRTVVAFTGEKKSIEAYNQNLKKAYQASVYQGFASGLGMGMLICIIFSSYSLAIWYGSRLIINQGYSGGEVINVMLAVIMGGMSLGQASPSLNSFASGQAAAYKMFEVINRVPQIDVYDLKGQVPKEIKGEIEFKDVTFHYPARPDVQIFNKFSIRIPEGITAALVGQSGSGKSTTISLIERFYDPQEGQILLDGVDIKKLQLKWLRQQVGLVSQEPILFGVSIKDNIAYGKNDATLEQIKEAAALANASTFITKMPEGYDTLIAGSQLSGGQKQRIAIARAILRNPRILLLDEATSALDTESEKIVQEALDRVMKGRTTVVVAHRLTTIRNADMIAVVEHGELMEMGKHEELLQNPDGPYSQLIKLQQMHTEESPKEENKELEKSPSLKQDTSDKPSISKSGSFSETVRRLSLKVSNSFRAMRSGSVQLSEDVESGDKKDDVPKFSLLRLAALNKPEVPILCLGSFAAILNGLIFPLYAILLSSVIKIFFEPAVKLKRDAEFWASIFLVLAAGALIVMPAQMYCFSIGGNRLIRRIRQMTFEKVLQQEISWFDQSENGSGAISARLSTDAAQVRCIVGDTLALAVQNASTVVAALIIAFIANWQLTLAVLTMVPLLGLHGYARVKFMKGFSADTKVMYEEASQVATDAVGSMRTVASFCAEDKVLNLYEQKCEYPKKKGIRQGIISGLFFGFTNFVTFAAYAFCFWLGAKLVFDGKTTFDKVFRVFFAITMGSMSVSQSASLLPDLTNAKSAVNSVFSLLDRKSKINPSDESGLTPSSVNGVIEFQNVYFQYPHRPNIPILSGMTLSVPARKTVALVGESGCGKSTVISLLLRFYDPDSGNIYLDGIDTKTLQVRWLRQQMGLVGQEPVLFNTTIRENFVYGVNGDVSETQIVEAAEAANAHRFISELPDGYETTVGERGTQLSGGQKQRVAIARAIIKDPKILLLDEATSALDAESEHIVQEALERVMVNRSVIVVAHRLSTIRNADVIAVVKNGAVVEQGSHDELMRTKGAYAALVGLHTA